MEAASGAIHGVRELQFRRSGRLAWHERHVTALEDAGDATVRPFVAGRCDGDTLPIHRPVSRALQAAMARGLVDPVVGASAGIRDNSRLSRDLEPRARVLSALHGQSAAPMTAWVRGSEQARASIATAPHAGPG